LIHSAASLSHSGFARLLTALLSFLSKFLSVVHCVPLRTLPLCNTNLVQLKKTSPSLCENGTGLKRDEGSRVRCFTRGGYEWADRLIIESS
jgi:hypothetical protein